MKLIKLFSLIIMVVFLSNVVEAKNFLGTNQDAAGKCMTCHKDKTHGLYNQWKQSAHAQHNVTCIDCHGANKSDADAFMHEGALIATLVTPKDCGVCHEKEAKEVQMSHHATAGLILESNDAYLAHVGGGAPVATTGCENCHGTKVIIDKNSPNMLSKKSWPNSGVGRLNPDGSKGSCTVCHTRHAFSKAQARQPESCSKCHLGPDHPQKEIYEESKHGNAYYTHKDEMNLKADRWVVGVDYFEAPTCATCHMSETTTQKVTHDVGARLQWNLRPPVSKKQKDFKTKRNNMQEVCSTCHTERFYEGHFYQFDALVNLFDEKFAKPAAAIMGIIKKNNLLPVKANMGNKIDWAYWELWHHEGRRARHGAAMMGPDYTWWHGIYDVLHNFYFEFIPEARELHNKDVDAYIDNLFQNDKMHKWLSQNTKDLKANIENGKQKAIYEHLFNQ